MFGKFFASPAAVILWSALSSPVLAQTDYETQCELKDVNGMVALMLCPAGLETEALSQEGIAACAGRLPCGVWIWTDAEFIPEVAPASHDELPSESVQNALGIWVNEDKKMIILEKVAKD